MSEFVSVFRTNISTEIEKHQMIKMLYALGRNLKASLDLDDEEKVLRIAATENMTLEVAQIVRANSYLCEEMDSFYLGNSVKNAR